MMTIPQLRDWHTTLAGTLAGQVYGDFRFADGERIRTSRVIRRYRRNGRLYARTHGSTYQLTGPDGQPYDDWLATDA